MGKILVVDDELEVCDSLKVFLEKEGNTVIVTTNGEDALSIIQDERIDLMLLDIRMSGLSGMEVLHRAKTIQDDIKIIMITSLEDDTLMHYTMEKGASDYIVKPFTMDYLTKILSAKINEILS